MSTISQVQVGAAGKAMVPNKVLNLVLRSSILEQVFGTVSRSLNEKQTQAGGAAVVVVVAVGTGEDGKERGDDRCVVRFVF